MATLTAAPVASDATQAILVRSGAVRDSHLEVAALFKEMSGDLRICDPYYGTGSLYRLDLLIHCRPIRFLTLHADSRQQSFISTALREFVSQHSHVEFRRSASQDLHDRYVLTEEEVVILGHGLKDIGKKESFIIRLAKDTCGDLMEALRHSFDAKWNAAVPLM